MSNDWDYAEPFVRRTRVEATDVDALQHTNNTIYVRWCEECAWEHSASLGMDIDAYHRLDRAMAVVEGNYRYLKASHLDDEIDTATWITHWDKRLTMTRHFQVRRVRDEATLLRAEVRFACIEISSGKPRRLPKEFLEAYGPAILGIEPK
ncbi:thioesterase family protein [Congregibacter variabilis]|uniref:Thioesterase family protein n=1 Tax=Congregibacter variabilis TaxID=3081200 RepID=A0ABZ0HZE3_9GAMM|nr:thioesterase family protein [Congregibacter sp. IMCC43200]